MANSKLTQTQVNRYCKVNTMLQALQKERNELRQVIVKALSDGQECPMRGPWIITLTQQERKSVNWKSMAQQLAKHAKLTNYLKKLVDHVPATTIQTLLVRPNPTYRGKVKERSS